MTENSMPLPYEDMIREAIIERFFAPIPLMHQVWRTDPSGQGYQSWEQTTGQTPMALVANEIYKARMNEIIAAVKDRITLDEIVDAVVPKVVAYIVDEFKEKNTYNSWDKPGAEARRKMLDAVHAKIADEFGKRAVAHLQATGGLMNALGGVIEE